MIKRFLEIFFAILIIILCIPILIIISVIILLSDGFPIFFWSKRFGQNNKYFLMPKFRTMKNDTPNLPTHLLKNKSHVIKSLSFIRKYSIDELPQLYNILIGNMTFIGPRPALFNQIDLIEMRTEFGIHKMKPGITGYAQINGRDNISLSEKVKLEFYYLKNTSILLNLQILFLTIIKVIKKDNIKH